MKGYAGESEEPLLDATQMRGAFNAAGAFANPTKGAVNQVTVGANTGQAGGGVGTQDSTPNAAVNAAVNAGPNAAGGALDMATGGAALNAGLKAGAGDGRSAQGFQNPDAQDAAGQAQAAASSFVGQMGPNSGSIAQDWMDPNVEFSRELSSWSPGEYPADTRKTDLQAQAAARRRIVAQSGAPEYGGAPGQGGLSGQGNAPGQGGGSQAVNAAHRAAMNGASNSNIPAVGDPAAAAAIAGAERNGGQTPTNLARPAAPQNAAPQSAASQSAPSQSAPSQQGAAAAQLDSAAKSGLRLNAAAELAPEPQNGTQGNAAQNATTFSRFADHFGDAAGYINEMWQSGPQATDALRANGVQANAMAPYGTPSLQNSTGFGAQPEPLPEPGKAKRPDKR